MIVADSKAPPWVPLWIYTGGPRVTVSQKAPIARVDPEVPIRVRPGKPRQVPANDSRALSLSEKAAVKTLSELPSDSRCWRHPVRVVHEDASFELMLHGVEDPKLLTLRCDSKELKPGLAALLDGADACGHIYHVPLRSIFHLERLFMGPDAAKRVLEAAAQLRDCRNPELQWPKSEPLFRPRSKSAPAELPTSREPSV